MDDDNFEVHVLSWEALVERLQALVPQGTYERDTRLDSIPAYQRIRILRWLTDFFETPTPLAQLEQFTTLGEIHEWLQGVLIAGEKPRQASHRRQGSGESTRVRLRPILEHDIMALYMASFDPANTARWRYRGRTLPIDEFVGTLFGGVVSQYMVEMVATGEAVGLVTAYEENRSGLNCKIAFLRCGDRAHGDSAAVFEGMLLFISFLFDNFPFRKLFAEVPADDMGMFADDFAQEEGVLKEYLFHNGEFVDLHHVSIVRERWSELAAETGW